MFGFLKKRRPDPRDALIEVLGRAQVPTIPAVVMQALEALRNPNLPMERITRKVGADPGLVALLLKTVNSAAFGLRRPVDSLQHAMVMLGRTHVESLVLSVAVKQALPRAPCEGFDARRFWKTAALRAATARALAELAEPRSRHVAFTAGLLQDLALPLLASARTSEYQPVLQQWYTDGGSLDDLEQARFGWDHADVAGWLCDEWKFPPQLTSAVCNHHQAGHAPVAVVLVGLLPEDPGDAARDRLIDTAQAAFSLSPDDVIRALDQGAEHSEELGRLLAS